jgi:hypothetical protein
MPLVQRSAPAMQSLQRLLEQPFGHMTTASHWPFVLQLRVPALSAVHSVCIGMHALQVCPVQPNVQVAASPQVPSLLQVRSIAPMHSAEPGMHCAQ